MKTLTVGEVAARLGVSPSFAGPAIAIGRPPVSSAWPSLRTALSACSSLDRAGTTSRCLVLLRAQPWRKLLKV
jgi:hypothetical protein